jgi:hypothetical protein
MDDYDEMFVKHLGILALAGGLHIALITANFLLFGVRTSDVAVMGVVLTMSLLGAVGGFWIDRESPKAVDLVNAGISGNAIGGLVASSVLAFQLAAVVL